MENKYYIPSIEEFFVGFEYEEEDDLEDNIWIPRTLDFSYDWLEIHKDFANDKRVKYLDSSDIEEEGFKHENGVCYKFGENYQLLLLEDRVVILEFLTETDLTAVNRVLSQYWYTRFEGKIKNKSELKKVLNMLNIK